MKNFKKALFTCTAVALTLSAGLALAQDKNPAKDLPLDKVNSSKSEAILFKIHDIKPVSDSEGNIKSCEYTATFYNRTHMTVRQAKMDLAWTDRMTSLFPIDEKENKEDAAKETAKPNDSAPKKDDAETIRTTLDIPSLNPLKQVVLNGNVQTDKCFALFDNLTFRVTDCNTLNTQESTNARVNRANEAKNQAACASLFSYVDSKNPEYYNEFKEVSYEEEVANEKETEAKENSFIDKAIAQIDQQFEKVKEILAKIK